MTMPEDEAALAARATAAADQLGAVMADAVTMGLAKGLVASRRQGGEVGPWLVTELPDGSVTVREVSPPSWAGADG